MRFMRRASDSNCHLQLNRTATRLGTFFIQTQLMGGEYHHTRYLERKVSEASPLCTPKTLQTETVRLPRGGLVSYAPTQVSAYGEYHEITRSGSRDHANCAAGPMLNT